MWPGNLTPLSENVLLNLPLPYSSSGVRSIFYVSKNQNTPTSQQSRCPHTTSVWTAALRLISSISLLCHSQRLVLPSLRSFEEASSLSFNSVHSLLLLCCQRRSPLSSATSQCRSRLPWIDRSHSSPSLARSALVIFINLSAVACTVDFGTALWSEDLSSAGVTPQNTEAGISISTGHIIK